MNCVGGEDSGVQAHIPPWYTVHAVMIGPSKESSIKPGRATRMAVMPAYMSYNFKDTRSRTACVVYAASGHDAF